MWLGGLADRDSEKRSGSTTTNAICSFFAASIQASPKASSNFHDGSIQSRSVNCNYKLSTKTSRLGIPSLNQDRDENGSYENHRLARIFADFIAILVQQPTRKRVGDYKQTHDDDYPKHMI